ncbi:ABC transporter ATP-binding protein [Chitinophaga silvatica]|uniref:ABC transporter ATP-binding protein n=1 Tax=Chitinophaga silvatica TaxID=2282649 RepID=A0A3E1Y3N9_9BACT|nr:ABC-F family ATP-binding cassette domain-containing protein [Chitinophaga silvatica]RFS19273.1 ABC transporter ATP-binding protein [Chitinophaga silvatica]
MLILQGVAYTHPNKDLLFSDINLIINKYDKAAIIGNNGAGKSTLLKIIAGQLPVSQGIIKREGVIYFVPQHYGQYTGYTIAQALGTDKKLNALKAILAGEFCDEDLITLEDDWTIEERCQEALSYWQLQGLDLNQKMDALSGGQKTKVFLAGIFIHQPDIVLLDEPSNHLDVKSRQQLYDYISTARETLVVVSHDIRLLNLLNTMHELSKKGITTYGGNYNFYISQRGLEQEALQHDIRSMEKALRKAKETERETIERQQKLDARGKKKQEKAGLPTISMKTFQNNAEKSTARVKGMHADKIDNLSTELNQLRKELPDLDKMKIAFDNSSLHKGKILITAEEINFKYSDKQLWNTPLSFQILSGERIAIKGNNGSGKTTLIKLLLGELKPSFGKLSSAASHSIYIDQDYSLINNELTVFEQIEQFNSGALQEHEIKIRLNRFLFGPEDWNKPCSALSGGEKMRLMLCSLTVSNTALDIIVLDEPTNNLDIQNIEILIAAISEYKGTLLVISHDESFLEKIGISRTIELN